VGQKRPKFTKYWRPFAGENFLFRFVVYSAFRFDDNRTELKSRYCCKTTQKISSFWVPHIMETEIPHSWRAFSNLAHFQTCGKVWLTRVQWPPCEHAGNEHDNGSKPRQNLSRLFSTACCLLKTFVLTCRRKISWNRQVWIATFRDNLHFSYVQFQIWLITENELKHVWVPFGDLHVNEYKMWKLAEEVNSSY